MRSTYLPIYLPTYLLISTYLPIISWSAYTSPEPDEREQAQQVGREGGGERGEGVGISATPPPIISSNKIAGALSSNIRRVASLEQLAEVGM